MPDSSLRVSCPRCLLVLSASIVAGIVLSASSVCVASSAVQVAVGGYHACVITAKGGVKCWGTNGSGELGDGTTAGRTFAADVRGLSSGVKAIAVGTNFTCALTASGGVKCWGSDYDGQLGIGDGTAYSQRTEPVDVTGLQSGVIAITAGSQHACAVTSAGGVVCWGYNEFGQLGDGTTQRRTTPVDVPGLGGVTAISAGALSTCALTSAGGVKCWGHGDHGQLGDGGWQDRPTAADVQGLTSGVLQLSVGDTHACALLRSGVKCWGADDIGQLGDGATVRARYTPVDVAGLSTGVAAISAGSASACALMTDGRVKCWGGGLPGDGTSTRSTTPIDIAGLKTKALSVAAGASSCAVTVGGAITCWGDVAYAALGGGPGSYRSSPGDVLGLYKGVTSIAVGGYSPCATTSAGALKCWGSNYYGNLGDGTTRDRGYPANVTGLDTGVASVAVNSTSACAVTTAGAVKCWGDNSGGQLGDGTTTSETAPVDVRGLSGGIVAVSAGAAHMCAVTSGGAVKCWGDNSSGQLGDGTTTRRLAPVDVAGLAGVGAVAAGGAHTCALMAGGGVKCWGANASGQLGDGTIANRAMPVDVIGLTGGVRSLVASGNHTCAVTTSGGVKCWGLTDWGGYRQPIPPITTPVDISGLDAGVASMSASRPNCAVMTDGGLKCWSSNTGPATDVTGLSDRVAAVSTSTGDTCVLLENGGLQCWGWNQHGQLGDGTLVRAGSIVTVPGFGTTGDFNDDGKPDIVNHDIAANQLLFWLMNGTEVASRQTTAGPPDRNWNIVAIGDLNEDGSADLAWHNTATGDDQIWLMAGTANSTSVSLQKPSPGDWHVVALADLNGDGRTDVVWRERTTGGNLVMCMDSSTPMGDLPLETWLDTNWTIAGAADFNGDDQPDLLWRNTATGENIVWFMNRTAHTGSASIESLPDVHWTVAQVADFDGDGSPDIAWRNAATGEMKIWLMAGTDHVGTVALPATPVLTSKRPQPSGAQSTGRAVIRKR